MAKNRLEITVKKEIELDSNFKETGEFNISAYLTADNGMSTWICSCNTKEELLQFINPDSIIENLECVLSQEEMNFFFKQLHSTPYYYDGKEYMAVV